MSITATTPAPNLIASIRGQIQSEFARARQSFQETGHVTDVSENFVSADGNVVISLSGRQNDGQDVLQLDIRIDGDEGAIVGRALTGGIDDLTGVPNPADTQYGGPGGSGSRYIHNLDDITALAQDMTHGVLDTQDEQDAKTTSWQYGDKVFKTREDFHAYMRVVKSAAEAADKIASKITFKSPQDEVDFVVKLQQAIMKQHDTGGDLDLSELMKDVPVDQLTKALKALDGSNAITRHLIKTLSDYLDARKTQEAQKSSTSSHPDAVNLVV
jgi:hypothetical protein